MYSMIAKVCIAALAAGAAHALPQGSYSSSSNTSVTLSSHTSSLAIPAPSVDPAAAQRIKDNLQLSRDIDNEPTQVTRFNKLLTINGEGKALLPTDLLRERIVFDFNKAKAIGEGGRGVELAARNTFPILTDTSIATAMAFLGPCGINTPHIHPRATEFLTVVEGKIQTGFVLENGFLTDAGTGLVGQISAELNKFEGTVFPQGSIHFQFNPTCENATFVASLNSDDPGASQIAQNFFSLDAGVVDASIGGGLPETITPKTLEEFRKHIPKNLARGMEECKMMCRID